MGESNSDGGGGGDNSMLISMASICCVIILVAGLGILGWKMGWFEKLFPGTPAAAPTASGDPMPGVPDQGPVTPTTTDPPVTGVPAAPVSAASPDEAIMKCPAGTVGGFSESVPKAGEHWCCPTKFDCTTKCTPVVTATGVASTTAGKSRADFFSKGCENANKQAADLKALQDSKASAAEIAKLKKQMDDDAKKMQVSGGKEPNCPTAWLGYKFWGSGANAKKCCKVGLGDGSDCMDPYTDDRVKCTRRKKPAAWGVEDPFNKMGGYGVVYDSKWAAPGFGKDKMDAGEGRKLCCNTYEEGWANGGKTNGWCTDPYIKTVNGVPDAAAHYQGTQEEYAKGVWKGNLWWWQF